jgi:hypothetical protein
MGFDSTTLIMSLALRYSEVAASSEDKTGYRTADPTESRPLNTGVMASSDQFSN